MTALHTAADAAVQAWAILPSSAIECLRETQGKERLANAGNTAE
jgi:hypothetical protein